MKKKKEKKAKVKEQYGDVPRKFISRSVHGSGAFSDSDIKKGYRCEPCMGD